MRRRDFIKAGAAGAAVVGMGAQALGKEVAPAYMPIVKDFMEKGPYAPTYLEPEITEPVDLCDANGLLNRAAVGWSRRPLTRANLSGHWPRKKRWNFWNWICPDYVFSVTMADIDYALFCAVQFTDFKTLENFTGIGIKRGNAIVLPEHVERTVTFEGGGMEYACVNDGGDIKVDFSGPAILSGVDVTADFIVRKPAGHETLNVVIPWSRERFQMNSKHNALPCEGTITVGGKTYEMDPANCHAVQDFGRGMWPYRSHWNWAVATGVVDGVTVGINMGDKWTTGTGANENGLCVGGKLYKVMEDLNWQYDPNDWMAPWRIKTDYSDMIDLTLTPIMVTDTTVSIGVLGTGGVCPFGHWNGVVRAGGNEIEIKNMIGWAEEFIHRW